MSKCEERNVGMGIGMTNVEVLMTKEIRIPNAQKFFVIRNSSFIRH
jgi:hypothetical protein